MVAAVGTMSLGPMLSRFLPDHAVVTVLLFYLACAAAGAFVAILLYPRGAAIESPPFWMRRLGVAFAIIGVVKAAIQLVALGDRAAGLADLVAFAIGAAICFLFARRAERPGAMPPLTMD